jgi:hypothetical protein
MTDRTAWRGFIAKSYKAQEAEQMEQQDGNLVEKAGRRSFVVQ